MDMPTHHLVKSVAVIALAVLAVTGCGREEAAPAAAPAPAAVPSPQSGAAAPAPATSPVIAKGEATDPGFRVEITELKRTGNDIVTLRMTFINDSQEGVRHDLYATGLLDLVEKRRYSPVNKGAEHECLCSEPWVDVEAHERAHAWIRFPAPPVTVEKVGIELEGFQPIDDVPISR